MSTSYELYFAVLRKLKDELDQPLEGMRDNYQGLSITKKGWIGPLFFRSLLGFKGYKAPKPGDVNKIVALFSHYYVALSGSIVAYLFVGLSNPFGLQWTSILTFLFPAIFLIGSIYSNLTRMLTIGDPMFHIGAYGTFRKKEYGMFLTYLNEPLFTFGGLNEWIAREITNVQKDKDRLVEILEKTNHELERDRIDLERELVELEVQVADYKDRYEEAAKAAEGLYESAKYMSTGYNRALDLLYWLKDPPQLKKEHLHLISDYSVFALRKNRILEHIDSLGPTETPTSIDIDDVQFAHYSSVKVIKNQSRMEFSESDREDRSIASYRFVMPNQSIWVYNFHYYNNSEIRVIIGTQQFYRLVKIMCILLQERNLLKEGEQFDA